MRVGTVSFVSSSLQLRVVLKPQSSSSCSDPGSLEVHVTGCRIALAGGIFALPGHLGVRTKFFGSLPLAIIDHGGGPLLASRDLRSAPGESQ